MDDEDVPGPQQAALEQHRELTPCLRLQVALILTESHQILLGQNKYTSEQLRERMYKNPDDGNLRTREVPNPNMQRSLE
jgi:hypothetical protein